MLVIQEPVRPRPLCFGLLILTEEFRPCRYDQIVCIGCSTVIYDERSQCITYSEWLTHQHRDTCASIVGHPTLASYLAIADGESIGRVRFEMTEVDCSSSENVSTAEFSCIFLSQRMLQPCGPPPKKDEE